MSGWPPHRRRQMKWRTYHDRIKGRKAFPTNKSVLKLILLRDNSEKLNMKDSLADFIANPPAFYDRNDENLHFDQSNYVQTENYQLYNSNNQAIAPDHSNPTPVMNVVHHQEQLHGSPILENNYFNNHENDYDNYNHNAYKLRPKQACDVCRIRKKRCDGDRPSCAYCTKVAKKNGRPSECTYSSPSDGVNPPGPNRKGFARLTKAVLSRLETVEQLLGSSGSKQPLDSRMSQFLHTSDAIIKDSGYRANSLSSASDSNDMFVPKQSHSADQYIPELVYHNLLSLSHVFYTGHSCDINMMHVVPAERGTELSPELKKAIAFHSTFYSSNSFLFQGNSSPTYEERVRAANQFKVDYSNDKIFGQHRGNQISFSMSTYDEIRAMIIQSMTLFGLGNLREAFMINCASTVKARFHHILDAKMLFNDPNNSADPSPDDFLQILPVSDQFKHKKLSFAEQQERISLYTMVLMADTFMSISQGSDFMIADDDESLDIVYPTPDNINPVEIFSRNRTAIPSLAKGTIWEGTAFAPMYDEAEEMKRAIKYFPVFAGFRMIAFVEGLRTCRQILRFSRNNKASWPMEKIAHTLHSLHEKALRVFEIFPVGFLPFHSLAAFAPDAPLPSMPHHSFGRVSNETHQYLHIALTMMSYLHFQFSQAGSNVLFALETGGDVKYTSKEIMFVVIRALGYLCDVAYIPITPDAPVLGPFNYMPGEAEVCFAYPVDSNLPSPLLAESTSALMCYIIATSTLSSARSTASMVSRDILVETEVIVREKIIPCIMKIGSLWPLAKVLGEKTIEILEGGQSGDLFHSL